MPSEEFEPELPCSKELFLTLLPWTLTERVKELLFSFDSFTVGGLPASAVTRIVWVPFCDRVSH
jgi:hypothetical protein